MNNKIVVSNEVSSVRSALSRSANSADRIEIAVAYLSDADLIESWVRRGTPVKLLVALQAPSDPRVLRHLLDSFQVGLELCFYSARFHSKLLIFWKDGQPTSAQVGSSNFTGGGLNSNIETNVMVREPAHLAELAEHFNQIWEQSSLLQPTDLDAYEKYLDETKTERDRLNRKAALIEDRVVLPRLRTKGTVRIAYALRS